MPMIQSIKSKASSIKGSIKGSGESQYEYDSQFGDDDDQTTYSDSDGETTGGDTLSRRQSSYGGGDDADAHLDKADKAMTLLQDLHTRSNSGWKRVLKHRSGAVVYMSKEKSPAGKRKNGKDYLAPVFKGEIEINGFNPSEVFGVVGSRKLWDEWYKEGNLVENLSDNASLTYMCMQGIASIALNGWILEPIDGGTRLSYYLLVNVKTFVPAFAHRRYLARRPTCIAKIADYLEKNGAPPMANGDPEPTANGGGGRRRRDSTSSKRSSRSSRSGSGASAGLVAGLPMHVATNTEANSYSELQKAQKLFKAVLGAGGSDWTTATDPKGNKILMRKRDGEGLPLVKGEAVAKGVTTEQVLGTILSDAARREWDGRFHSTQLVQSENGFDQGEFIEQRKGIFPGLDQTYYTIARGVDRDDVQNEHGEILVVSRSVKKPSKSDFKEPKGATKGQMDVYGFLLEPKSADSVKITQITQLDVDAKLSGPISKIVIGEMARGPSEIAEYIDENGYAPYFVRWGEGPACLETDAEPGTNLRNGKAVIKVNGQGKGTMKNGQQKCWLQWSDKMYERGIDISIEPKGAAELARVDGIDRTVEFAWSEKVKDGVKITLSRSDEGQGSDDVYVDGEFLDKTVGMEKGKAKKAAPAAAAAKKSNGKSNGKSSSSSDEEEEEQQERKQETQKSGKRGGAAPVAAIGGAAAAVGGAVAYGAKKAAAPITPASASRGASNEGGEGAGGETATKTKIPADACLIISEDLYFTKSQCAVIGGIIFVAYILGRFK